MAALEDTRGRQVSTPIGLNGDEEEEEEEESPEVTNTAQVLQCPQSNAN